MIQTPVCKLLDIDYPIALGGMGSATSPELVSAVSNAGGLGALGCHYLTPEQIGERTTAIRGQTNKPFGLNFLLFDTREDSFAAALEFRPAVMQFAWARPQQLPIVVFPGCGHFFHGRLPQLQRTIAGMWQR